MFRAILILVAIGDLAWLIGLYTIAAHLLGIVVLIGVAAFVGSALGGCRDQSGRELYRRNLRSFED